MLAPAIVHFVVQAVPKTVTLPPGDAARFTLAWIAACAKVPWLALLSAVDLRSSKPTNPSPTTLAGCSKTGYNVEPLVASNRSEAKMV
jgi:hypothetical protein